MGATRDCKHGQLARSCEVCELEADNAALRARVTELEAALEQCSDMCRWRSSDHYATCEDNCKLGRAEECPANIPRIFRGES